MSTVVYPIWQDVYVPIGYVDSQAFVIRTSDDRALIYSGKAYKKPTDSALQVKINDICADYLQPVLPSLHTSKCYPQVVARSFNFYTIDPLGGEILIATIPFIADWSYDYSRSQWPVNEQAVLSDPINGRVTAQMAIPVSIYSGGTVTMQILDAERDVLGTFGIAGSAGDFLKNESFNNDFFTSDPPPAANGGVYMFNLPQVLTLYPTAKYLTVAGLTYEIMPDCYKYALYYLNAYGGWDCFLVDGGDKTTDNYTRSTFKQEYDNTLPSNRGTVNYLNTISRTISLGTGYMTDAESAKMHHLVGSTNVYLYDIMNDELRPVVMSTNSLVKKTYRNNGAQLVRYDFNVELAQQMSRR